MYICYIVACVNVLEQRQPQHPLREVIENSGNEEFVAATHTCTPETGTVQAEVVNDHVNNISESLNTNDQWPMDLALDVSLLNLLTIDKELSGVDLCFYQN